MSTLPQGLERKIIAIQMSVRRTSFQSITTIALKNNRGENVGLSKNVQFKMWINGTLIDEGTYNGQAVSGGFNTTEFLQVLMKQKKIVAIGPDGKPTDFITCSCQSDDPGRVFATQETRISNVLSFVNLPKPGVAHQLPDITVPGVGLGTRFSWRVNLKTGAISKV